MKEIELIEKNESAHKEYDTLQISEGIGISASRDIKDGVVSIEGNIVRSNKNIGRFVFSESQGRLFVNCEVEDMLRSTRLEIVETVTSIITQLTPAEEEEAAAEEN